MIRARIILDEALVAACRKVTGLPTPAIPD